MSKKFDKTNRRDIITAGGLAALGGALLPAINLTAQEVAGERRYIFTIAGAGGASILDSFLAQTSGPNAFTAAQLVQPAGSNIRGVLPIAAKIQNVVPLGNGYSQGTFLSKHFADVAVMTHEVSSVNHLVAAKRAMTGDNICGGRTIGEAIAAKYGAGLTIPNLALAGGGYVQNGDDNTLSSAYRGQFVADPLMFAFATHGFKGINQKVSSDEMANARALRMQLESVSRFYGRFKESNVLGGYLRNRERVVSALEKGDMVTKLMLLDPTSNNLAQFGFKVSPDFQLVLEKFPALATDPFEARMALAFLAVKNGVSTAVTVAPPPTPIFAAGGLDGGTPNAPIAFDWSHADHRGAQTSMWSYMLRSIDGLIDLLKVSDIDGDPAKGKMWSKSLIYIATEFGRDRVSSGGSGHHLNNGVIMISPLLKGNKVYGGVDPASNLTYGFDPLTGAPDPNRKMKEGDVFSAAAHALELEFEGRHDFPSMVRKA